MRLPATALALTTGLWAGSVRAAPVEALLLPVEARGVPVQKAERVDRSLGDYAVGIRQPIEADRRKAPRYGCRDDVTKAPPLAGTFLNRSLSCGRKDRYCLRSPISFASGRRERSSTIAETTLIAEQPAATRMPSR